MEIRLPPRVLRWGPPGSWKAQLLSGPKCKYRLQFRRSECLRYTRLCRGPTAVYVFFSILMDTLLHRFETECTLNAYADDVLLLLEGNSRSDLEHKGGISWKMRYRGRRQSRKQKLWRCSLRSGCRISRLYAIGWLESSDWGVSPQARWRIYAGLSWWLGSVQGGDETSRHQKVAQVLPLVHLGAPPLDIVAMQ